MNSYFELHNIYVRCLYDYCWLQFTVFENILPTSNKYRSIVEVGKNGQNCTYNENQVSNVQA